MYLNCRYYLFDSSYTQNAELQWLTYDSTHQVHAFLYAFMLGLNLQWTDCILNKQFCCQFSAFTFTVIFPYIYINLFTYYSSSALNQTELTLEYILSECNTETFNLKLEKLILNTKLVTKLTTRITSHLL